MGVELGAVADMAVLQEGLAIKRTNDVMSAEQVYSACETCTAKWFAKSRLRHCPRCGSGRLLHTAARPPWEGAGGTHDNSICRDERQGDTVAHRATNCEAVTEADDSPTASTSPGESS